MKLLRRVNGSAAAIAVVCFFLPWVQVSCAGARDALSGFDLARNGHGSLWFLPALMVLLLLYAIIRIRGGRDLGLSLTSILSGLVGVYLMNGERVRVHNEAGLVSAQLTGWFWLGFISALAVALAGVAILLKREGPS